MGCCSSPRTTIAGVAVLHFFGALGCIGLCGYLLSVEGPKLEQILTQSWTLLTTMHLPIVLDADGNVVSNHSRSNTELVTLDKSNTSHSRPVGRSAYGIQPLLDDTKNDALPLRTVAPQVVTSEEPLRYDSESSEIEESFVVDREARILDEGFDENVKNASLITELPTTTQTPDIEPSELTNELEDYITENIPVLPEDTGPFYQNMTSENSSLSEEYENVTEVPIIDFDSARSSVESFLSLMTTTTEDTNAVSMNSDRSVLYVDVPDHTVTSVTSDTTDPTTPHSSVNTVATSPSQAPPRLQDETSTPSSQSSSEESLVEATSIPPSNFPSDVSSEGDALTSTEFIPLSPKNLNEFVTETSAPQTPTSTPPSNLTGPAATSTTSFSRSTSPIPVTSTTNSTRRSEIEEPVTSGLLPTSTPTPTPTSIEEILTSEEQEVLPSALPLRSREAGMYSHLLVDENSSSVNVDLTNATTNVSSNEEEPFTITVPPIITTTGFLSTLLISNPDTVGDPELESLVFELRAGASVLGLLVYFIVCAIAAALLIAAAIWRLEALMVPWLVMEWISVFGAITAVGVLTWRLLVEGVLLYCWWVVVLCTAGVVVLILCLVLVLEAYQTLPYEAACDATDSYEMQYVTDKRR